jgi:hypothetical protein
MDMLPSQFGLFMRLLEQRDKKLYEAFKKRYHDEPKPDATMVRIKEIEDIPKIIEASNGWDSVERESIGFDDLEIMVPEPWKLQTPHPVPDQTQIHKRGRSIKTQITVKTREEASGPVAQSGPGYNEMVFLNSRAATGVLPSIKKHEFDELVQEFQPVSNQRNNE